MQAGPKKALSLFDSTCIIVGIIIGVGIYETAPIVAASMGSWTGALGIWLIGGMLSLTGALCYAELASAYPQEGGDYVYQNRAYGNWAGYLFGWSQLLIVRPADIALLSFIFARYAQVLFPEFENSRLIYAAAAVVVLTIINVLGVKEGKWTQNLLTVIKASGIMAIIIAGLAGAGNAPLRYQAPSPSLQGFELALILVLFTFGGWNEMAYVAAEVKRPQRNIVRALLIGVASVIVLYTLINCAFLYALGYEKMSASQAVAVDTVANLFPDTAAKMIGILISISALGAVNGLIFTGARISYAMGTEHVSFNMLGKWNRRLGTPAVALVVQGCLSVAIVLLAGSFIDTILYTAPAVWMFFLATGLSVFVLRQKEPHTIRPYKIIGYPVTAIIFIICCIFMLYSSISYALTNKPIGLFVLSCILIAGVIFFWLTEGRKTGSRSRNLHS